MSTAVATVPNGGAVATKKDLQSWLSSDNFKQAVAMALPKHCTPDRFIRIALTAVMKTPDLLKCTQESVFKCLLDLSATGLEPDGRRAHLIPFNNKFKDPKTGKEGWRQECQLILDYKGIVELVLRSGLVSNIHADVICDNDVFDYDLGRVRSHKIDFKNPRGKVYAVFCRIQFKDGTETAEVMTVDEIEKVRSMARSKDSPAWRNHWNEMAKKVVFKRLSKWVPWNETIRDIVQTDDDNEFDFQDKKRPAPVAVDLTSFLPSPDENRGHDAANPEHTEESPDKAEEEAAESEQQPEAPPEQSKKPYASTLSEIRKLEPVMGTKNWLDVLAEHKYTDPKQIKTQDEATKILAKMKFWQAEGSEQEA